MGTPVGITMLFWRGPQALRITTSRDLHQATSNCETARQAEIRRHCPSLSASATIREGVVTLSCRNLEVFRSSLRLL